ncbi:sensor histidine kinase [Halarcobacter ebronensis]|uniref:histidine kinase n=1 Tax=Halarcobacter ebronensis TaxID=1462615 RepID=A0A4Q1AQ13_9BACT|nr:cache domain-containing protein [Halarcobacter ebronensis]RXK04382.1 histidine kinase [Halarcobacter ebronensis]
MNDKNERIILLIIKYTPPFFIIFLSILMSFILFKSNNSVYEKEKNITKQQLIESNKKIVKSEVIRLNRYIDNEANQIEEKLKEALKNRVNEAYTIALNIYNNNKHLGKEAVTKIIKDALRDIRFNKNRGYFFIHSFQGKCILLPIDSSKEGKILLNYKDKNGIAVTNEIMKKLKERKDNVYFTYYFYKPGDKSKEEGKISYSKYFKPLDWLIGTGEDIDDFENDIKEDIASKIKYLNSSEIISDYYFIFDAKGKTIDNHESMNNPNQKYTNPNTISKIIKETKEKKETFVTYLQDKKPGTNMATNKTSYIIYNSRLDWFIGKGFYEDEIHKIISLEEKIISKRLKENLKKLIVLTIFLTFVLLFVSLYMSNFLERKFKNYRKQIESNLQEITKQQNILAQQSKMAAIGTMIGNIAHQWRQPLSLISTIATGLKLKKELDTLSDEDFYEGMDKVNDTTQYLSKTIDDFRNFFNSNKVKKEFTIKDAFENCFNLVNVQFKNHDINIIEEIGESKIYGIQTELVQVLINILNNSRDELLKLEPEEKRYIFINTKEINDELIITIKDNAGGIKEEILDNIFEPYFTTKHQSQGTGIGLYMSEEIIVKHMRGTITIENAEYDYKGKPYIGALATIKLKVCN